MNFISTVKVAETGGRNFLYYGQLKDGHFFAFGMDALVFYNDNYENSFSGDGFKWEKRHKVREITDLKDIRAFKKDIIEAMEKDGGFSALFIAQLKSVWK